MTLFDRYAYLLALLAAENQPTPWTGAKIGCSLVHNGKVIAVSGNEIEEPGEPRVKHAEIICMEQAKGMNIPLNEATLYVTTNPCSACETAITDCGISYKHLNYWRGHHKETGEHPGEVLRDLTLALPMNDIKNQFFWEV